MLCRDVIKMLEEYAPVSLAEAWDNPGLQTGDEMQQIRRIMIALDATDDVVDQAVDWKADLLITHHPLIFSAMKKITEDHFIGRRLRKMIRNDISLYAMHTNCDVAQMADSAAERLGLVDTTVLSPLGAEKGIGKIGRLLKELSIEELAAHVKDTFGIPYVQVAQSASEVISTVAISPGSGHDFVAEALEGGADCLITGDMTHHATIDATAQGLHIIDAGHFGTEKFMKDDLFLYFIKQEQIRKNAIEIRLADEREPMVVM